MLNYYWTDVYNTYLQYLLLLALILHQQPFLLSQLPYSGSCRCKLYVYKCITHHRFHLVGGGARVPLPPKHFTLVLHDIIKCQRRSDRRGTAQVISL